MQTYEYQMRLTNFLERARLLFPNRIITSREANGDIVKKTYQEEYQRISQLANVLKAFGIKKREAIASFAWNTHRHYELYFAAPCMGVAIHTINLRMSMEDIIYSVEKVEDKLFFIEEDLIPQFEPVAEVLNNTLSDIKGYVILSDKKNIKDLAPTTLSPLYLYEDIIANENTDFDFNEDFDENTIASVFFTGGTTGRPKGVAVTHRHMFLRSLAMTSVEQYSIGQRDTIIHVVPMFHVNGWYFPQTGTLVGANQVYPGPGFTPEIILDLIAQEKVTISGGVPTIWMDCLNQIKAGKKKHDIGSLTRVICGGSALPRNAMEEYNKLGVNFVHAYGSSESPFISSSYLRPELDYLPVDEQWKYKASVGMPFVGTELKVLHDDESEVKWDGKDMGQIVARSPWTITSYYKESVERNAGSFKNGWYYSGDIATVDKYGYINIVDRLKDLIKSGGEWISSIDLENICTAHPDIIEACAIAAKHDRWGERPVLLIIPDENKKESINEEDILHFLSTRVPKWWLPDKIIITSSIARTGVGKMDKKKIRDKYKDVLIS